VHKRQSTTRIQESNTQGYNIKHFNFTPVGQAKNLLVWEENTSPVLDKVWEVIWRMNSLGQLKVVMLC